MGRVRKATSMASMTDVTHSDSYRRAHTAYALICPVHGDLGSAVGAFAAGRVLRQHHPCLDAYAEPRRRERRRGG
jgi:hypothetical protein